MTRRAPSLAAALLATLVASPAQAAAPCAGADRQLGPKATAEVVRCLVDGQRAAAGVPTLRPDARLGRAARRQVRGIVRTGVFAHQVPGVPGFPGRLRAARFTGRAAGENLAWGTGSRSTPRSIVRSWLASPPHRRNMLRRDFRRVGVATARRAPSGGAGVTVAAVFGTGA